MTIPTIPSIFYEFAFNADPNQAVVPPYWTDLSARVQFGWKTTRGRQYELDANETGLWQVELANTDGALDPDNTASPYWPGVVPYRQCRIRVVVGNNLLLPDQACAGEYAGLYAGPLPAWLGVTVGTGNTVAIATVGASAYQGTQVYATTAPAGTAVGTLMQASVPTVTAGQAYTFSIQGQSITAGQTLTVAAAIDWIGTGGQVLSTTTGGSVVLTGASGTWTQAVATGTAPTGAAAAALRLAGATVPSATVTVWTDGLQLEARGYVTRWQMPWTPGVNMLPQVIATGTETMNPVTDQVGNWFYAAGGTLAQAANLTAAPSGQSTAVAWTLPAGTYSASPAVYVGNNIANLTGPVADCVQVVPGRLYTGSVYLSRTGTDPTVTAAGGINWFDSSGNVLSGSFSSNVTVPTSGWVRLSVIHTAPAGAVWGRMFFYMSSASLAATEVIYATGWQFEQASSASAWADPGPPVFLFTGMVERWPQTWDQLDGTYGTSRLECPDAFAALAQPQIQSPFVNEVLAMNPTFFYQLNDPAGSSSVADTAGKRIPAPVESSPYGVGSLTFGNSITSTSPAGSFVGTSGPVATVSNTVGTGTTSTGQLAETFVSIHKTSTRPGPSAGTAGGFTRIIAFRTSYVPTGSQTVALWWASGPNQAAGVAFSFVSGFGGSFFMQYTDSGNHAWGGSPATSGVFDNNWHLAIMSVQPGTNGSFLSWYDGVLLDNLPGFNIGSWAPFTSDTIGCYVNPTYSYYSGGFIGDVAHAIELPFAVNAAQAVNLYNSWRSASSAESSGARYARILQWVGWTGPTAIDTGSTTSMGPATDASGQSALNALNLTAATENGDSYASAAGVLTFRGRSALYGTRTPQIVFGEGRPVGNAGEWPCEIGSIDYDPAHLANSVAVTRYQGAIYSARDLTSQRRYFPRQYQRTVNSTLSSEPQDAATYLLSQLKTARKRANVIQLHPSAVPGLFPAVAQVDKGARMRLVKRPAGAPPTTIDGYVQRIAWTCSPDSDFYVEYQASPADLTNYWVMGALHSTLNVQAAAGQNHATINALPDAAVNKLAQSLPSGSSLTFEPGTARAETIAIATGGIPSTSLGYSTATLTMAGNFAFTHPAGSVVCERLPTGYTDPTTWDAASVLGAAYAVITAPAGSFGLGATQLPIGPLGDAASNPLSVDWYPGQTLWISPGTPRFQTQVLTAVSATVPGWTGAILTFASLTAGWQFGDYVCEPLPAGVTDPTAINPTTRAAY